MPHQRHAATLIGALVPESGARASADHEVRRFAAALEKQGVIAHVERMRFDPSYARERLAFARTLADDALREHAVRLFKRYEPSAAPHADRAAVQKRAEHRS